MRWQWNRSVWIIDVYKRQPCAPFYLTEYKLDGTDLELSSNKTRTLDCTIKKGSTVDISLQSTTQNRVDQQYYLPFRLYLDFDKVFGRCV